MYPISGRTRREPRQPVKEKGFTRYTTETPEPDGLEARKKASAIVAHSLHEEAEATPEVVTRQVEPTKEKPMKERTRLPLGEQGFTVAQIIKRLKPGTTFDAESLWAGHFTTAMKNRWVEAYGSKRIALAKIRHAISNVIYAGKVEATNIEGGLWKTDVDVTLQERADEPDVKELKAPKTRDKPFIATNEPKDQTYPSEYKLIGHDLMGKDMYMDEDGSIGVWRMTFMPITN